ncbi:hypothetical protein LMG23992_05102 [Cupriavidus laharis]|uniref:Uncharacterized protein n=1 Tax=Cupriavidus laharis TaxID=151654 RepID=A0ABN7ZFW8_9BURK|nr:hypothetical protein LMG23992_05102 [Cupriavidus laharis]
MRLIIEARLPGFAGFTSGNRGRHGRRQRGDDQDRLARADPRLPFQETMTGLPMPWRRPALHPWGLIIDL